MSKEDNLKFKKRNIKSIIYNIDSMKLNLKPRKILCSQCKPGVSCFAVTEKALSLVIILLFMSN